MTISTGQPKEESTCSSIDLETGSFTSFKHTSSSSSSSSTISPTTSDDVLPNTFIFVRDSQNKTMVLNIHNNTTIEEICRLALEKSNTPSAVAPYPENIMQQQNEVLNTTSTKIKDMRLQYGGKTLEGNRTLSDYNISTGATLDLSTRLNGGIDGMTIMAFAILGAIALYLLYRLVLLIIKFGKWLWRFLLRAPVCWCSKNCCAPVCATLRFFVYTLKETCCALCDCCDLHYHPWKRMEITS